MGFLKRLFRAGTPGTQALPDVAPEASGNSRDSGRRRQVKDHPNAPLESPSLRAGAPERHTFAVPDGIVVLARTASRVRLNRTSTADVQATLVKLPKEPLRGVVLRLERAGSGSTTVRVDSERGPIGVLPRKAADAVRPILEEWEARGWEVRTFAWVGPASESGPDGGADGGRVADVAVPIDSDSPYASAYDASFLFPRDVVFGAEQTPEGKAAVDG